MPGPDRASLEGLIKRANLHAHILRTLTTGIPRLDAQTRETVARAIVLKVRLALLQTEAPDA